MSLKCRKKIELEASRGSWSRKDDKCWQIYGQPFFFRSLSLASSFPFGKKVLMNERFSKLCSSSSPSFFRHFDVSNRLFRSRLSATINQFSLQLANASMCALSRSLDLLEKITQMSLLESLLLIYPWDSNCVCTDGLSTQSIDFCSSLLTLAGLVPLLARSFFESLHY